MGAKYEMKLFLVEKIIEKYSIPTNTIVQIQQNSTFENSKLVANYLFFELVCLQKLSGRNVQILGAIWLCQRRLIKMAFINLDLIFSRSDLRSQILMICDHVILCVYILLRIINRCNFGCLGGMLEHSL